MSADGAALIAAAVQAAIQAKAPRRTVAAVAAAVASAFARPVAARATPAAGGNRSDGLQCAADTGRHVDEDVSAHLEALRSARSAQRKRKKERRRAAKAASAAAQVTAEAEDGRASPAAGVQAPADINMLVSVEPNLVRNGSSQSITSRSSNGTCPSFRTQGSLRAESLSPRLSAAPAAVSPRNSESSLSTGAPMPPRPLDRLRRSRSPR